jgi:hypothetical protein
MSYLNKNKSEEIDIIKELIMDNTKDSFFLAMLLMIDLEVSDTQWLKIIPQRKISALIKLRTH